MKEAYAHILEAVEEVEEQIESRPKKFRASSLPYCPLLDVLDRLSPEGETFTYRSHFYFGVGHAVHHVWQTAMVNGKWGRYCYGGWKCSKCGTLDPVGVAFRPSKRSPCCKAIWFYEEVALEYLGLTGHIDMMVRYPKQGWMIYDLKTTSRNILRKPEQFLPFRKNVFQIAAYCVLVRWLFGIKVKNYMLLYGSRDDPSSDNFHPAFVQFTEAKYWQWSVLVKVWLYGHRAADKFMADPSKKTAADLVNSRPCHSKEDYKEGMQGAFFRDECEFYKNGICAKAEVPLMQAKILGLIRKIRSSVNARQ